MAQTQIPLFALPPAEDEIDLEVRVHKENPGLYCAIVDDGYWMAWGKTHAAAVRNVVKRFKAEYYGT